MIDIVADMITQAIDICMDAIIIAAIAVGLTLQAQIIDVVDKQNATAAQMSFYREYNGFDNKHVYSSDIVGLIMDKRGYPKISVEIEDTGQNINEVYVWSLEARETDYVVQEISAKIPPNYLYHSYLEYTNGDLSEIQIRTCNGQCNGGGN